MILHAGDSLNIHSSIPVQSDPFKKPLHHHGARCSSVIRAFMVDSLSYFSFQPVHHDWCNKGCGMCYPDCGMVYRKEPLLKICKSSLCSGGSGFPFSLSEWSFTICPMPYNRTKNVLSASLNEKHFHFHYITFSESLLVLDVYIHLYLKTYAFYRTIEIKST